MEYTVGTKVFDVWEIKRQIGEGANGKVYEIERTEFGLTIKSALKVIQIPKTISDIQVAMSEGMDEESVTNYFEGFVQELVGEIAIMSQLKSHSNIVSFEDYRVISHEDSIGWDILIRMELLTPMTEYLLTHTMSEKEVIQLGCDLCNILSFCQQKGLVHRDIKPGNIFVNEAGQFKLGDFGIARTVEKTMGGLSRKGTEGYMAPEVYFGKPYNATVDIYSVGLVLYRLMNNNRMPFLPPVSQPIRFTDRENALARRMQGDVLPVPVNASPELAEIILKASSYNSADRYRTAEEMLDALRNIGQVEECPIVEVEDDEEISEDTVVLEETLFLEEVVTEEKCEEIRENVEASKEESKDKKKEKIILILILIILIIFAISIFDPFFFYFLIY